jgi:hypothetical protein
MPTQAEKYAVAMAGEHYVAAELLRRGVAAAVTMGNAKRADVIAIDHTTTRAVVIEVKSSPNKEWIVGSEPPVTSEQPWVFVHVPSDFSPPRYFILTASEIRDILLPGHEAYCKRYECKYGSRLREACVSSD